MTSTIMAVVFVLVLVSFAMGYGIANNEQENKFSKHTSKAELPKRQLDDVELWRTKALNLEQQLNAIQKKAVLPQQQLDDVELWRTKALNLEQQLNAIQKKAEIWHANAGKMANKLSEENEKIRHLKHELANIDDKSANQSALIKNLYNTIKQRDKTISDQGIAIQKQNDAIDSLEDKLNSLQNAYEHTVSEAKSYKKGLDTYFLNQMDIINDTAQSKREEIYKKVKHTESGIMLIPNNPSFEPMFFSKAEIATKPVQIIGRVVELRRTI